MNRTPTTTPSAQVAANLWQTRNMRRETVEKAPLRHLLQKRRPNKFEGYMSTGSTSRASSMKKSTVSILRQPHLQKNRTISEDFSDDAQLHKRRLFAVAGSCPYAEAQKNHTTSTPHMPNATPNITHATGIQAREPYHPGLRLDEVHVIVSKHIGDRAAATSHLSTGPISDLQKAQIQALPISNAEVMRYGGPENIPQEALSERRAVSLNRTNDQFKQHIIQRRSQANMGQKQQLLAQQQGSAMMRHQRRARIQQRRVRMGQLRGPIGIEAGMDERLAYER